MSELDDVRNARKKKKEKGKGIGRDMVMTPPIWGTLYPPDPELWRGKVTLMEKIGGRWGGNGQIEHYIRQCYFKNEDVERKQGKGWSVVDYIDPTQPAHAPTPPPIEEPPEEVAVEEKPSRMRLGKKNK